MFTPTLLLFLPLLMKVIQEKKKNEDFSHSLLVLYFEDGEFDDIHNLGFSNV